MSELAFKMPWYEGMACVALGIFLVTTLFHLGCLIRTGRSKDLAPAAGRITPAVLYALTGALNPRHKESAFLHFPTYIAGILFHLGTFLSMLLFFLQWMNFVFPADWIFLFSGFLIISAGCGLGMLLKRMGKMELRTLSNPDDYLANILVTLFQAGTLLILWFPAIKPAYFLLVSILLLYIPVGKLKHAIYFFAARFHLGVFYGRRGVWPPGRQADRRTCA